MRSLLAASCAALVMTVTGCGDPNAGAQKIADFEAWLAEHPADGVSVESSMAREALPWVGKGEVQLLVADLDGLIPAADHACDYNRTHEASALDFSARVGAVVVPVDCGTDDMSELDGDVQRLNELRGLAYAELTGDADVQASFRAKWQLLNAYPILAAEYNDVTASTDDLTVIGNAYADRDVRDALIVQLDDLSPYVDRVIAQPRSGPRPSHLSVTVPFRAAKVRREMKVLTPGVPIKVFRR